MTQFFNRWMPLATFLGWGCASLFFGTDGRFLAPPFTLYAKIAGVLLVLIGLVLAFTRPDVSCCDDSACSHGLSRTAFGRFLTLAVIALPIGLLPFASKASLEGVQMKNRKEKQAGGPLPEHLAARKAASLAREGAARSEPQTAEEQAVAGKLSDPPPLPLPTSDGSKPPEDPNAQKHPAAAEQQSFADYLQRTPDGTIIAEVLDLLYAAQDQVLRKDFEGKKVEMVVQFMKDSSETGGTNRFKGVRMFMTCCAADARPIATLAEAERMPDFPEMTWVKITGTSTFPIEKGKRISVLKAEKVEKTAPPEENMVY